MSDTGDSKGNPASDGGLLHRFEGDPIFRWVGAGMLLVPSVFALVFSVVKAFDPNYGPGMWLVAVIGLFGTILSVLITLGIRWAYGSALYVSALPVAFLWFFKWRLLEDGSGVPVPVIIGAVYSLATFAILFLGKPAAVKFDPYGDEARGKSKGKDTDPLEWTRDNVEAIAVAFLMALIIRCFCVEVFKIPTGSMEPTLYGDTRPGEVGPAHEGDRIMVDKIGLIFNDVRRFDVCVFKYPLDRSRNFIKRIVGLPDEDLRVDHGDIWTRPHEGGDGKFHLARKPAREQAGIWLHAWPGDDVSAEKCRKMWDGAPAGCYADGAVFDTGPAKGEATFRLQVPVKDYYRGKGTSGRVNDLAVRFKATMAPGSELFLTNARSDGYGRFTTTLAADGTVRFSHQPDEKGTFTPLPAPTPATAGAVGENAEVEIAQWDGGIRVKINGREVAAWEYVDVLPDRLRMPDAPAFQLSFGSHGGAVKFAGLWVGRDILYNETGQTSGESALTGKEFLAIPKDRYFAIGDNVCNSKDGRLWKERIVKLKNGFTMKGDGDSPENYPQNTVEGATMERFRDLDGTDHFFAPGDVEDRGDGEKPWHPFIAREEMVGKALVVWWPMARFKRIR